MTIGVLALQGDFALHEQALGRCGVTAVPVRRAAELDTVAGLVIPGGESTTLLRLLETGQFVPAIERFHRAGKPIFGTCAGLILLAREVEQPRQFSLGLIDVTVERNAYGRQRESFAAPGTAVLDGRPTDVEMVFIRAPRVRRVGSRVASLATLGNEAVLVREGSVLGATFHPELTEDATIHEYFCRMAS